MNDFTTEELAKLYAWMCRLHRKLVNADMGFDRPPKFLFGKTIGADLQKANMSGAYLRGHNFCNADLTGTDFSNADLSGASLESSCLVNCIFRDTEMHGVNMRNADVRGAVFYATDLSCLADDTGVDWDTAKTLLGGMPPQRTQIIR